ncbi:MAG TPA: bifunctional UDP-N-acetylglucosamine diphosphorylase/glucosamine-1-phosphate N-acetyltransferase GlmU [Fimbriimonadaceae bacterium]|nr:bifunctional UDP-N-acetylglucosamine diphosphorylase/glucosamine-1-phosphate N-acetyltransferase GlmU [Fimbriimonadaceae bacterium]
MAAPSLAGIVLAAGKGTRMKSDLPKCLHPVCGLPMAELAVRAVRAAGAERVVVVVGHGGDQLKAALGDSVEYAWQTEQLGTGHAAMAAQPLLANHVGSILVVPGDAPLLRGSSLTELVTAHGKSGAAMTLATVRMDDPTGYGRVIYGADGMATGIVEEKDADAPTRALKEVCVSVYAFDARALFESLPKLANANAQGEYYLTDTVGVLAGEARPVQACLMPDPSEFEGVNDRWQLAKAEHMLRLRILESHARNGVTIGSLETVFIGPDVQIGAESVLEAGSLIGGKSTIGEGCRIGPYSSIENVQIGDGCKILLSHLRRCTVGSRVNIGPYANIRPYARIGDDCKIGNFVEVKNAHLEAGVSASHLSYIGDAFVGAATNVGAGVITCNYDGFNKHRTEIGSGVFVGSNSTLVAPVTIGDGAIVAAGSVVTVDVPGEAGAFGRARTEIKEGWAAKWRARKQMEGATP